MRCLADVRGERSICILQPSTGADGVPEARAVHEAGGVVVLVESKASTTVDGGPVSAFEAVGSYFIGPPDAVGRWVGERLRLPTEVERLPRAVPRTKDHGRSTIDRHPAANEERQSSHKKVDAVDEALHTENVVGIGERLDAQEGVRAEVEHRDLLQNVLEVLNDGYWDWRIQDDYEYMSPRFWRMFGYDPAEKRHHPSEWQSMIHPEDLPATLDNFERHVATRGKHPYRQDVRYRHRDGHWVTVRCRGRVVEWSPDGKPIRMVGTHTDLTSLKRLDERHRLVIEGASVGIWDWLDVNDDAEVWSPRFYSLLGYDDGEIEASLTNFRALLHPDDQPYTFDAVAGHFERNAPFDVEYRLLTKTRGYRWFRGMGVASRDEAGRPVRMVGSIQDIHDRKLAEERLRQSNEELQQFAYVASHDLRAPVRHISASVGFLQEELGPSVDPAVATLVDKIGSSAQRMQALITSLLEFSRLERSQPTNEAVNLSMIVTEAIDVLAAPLKAVDGEIEVSELPTVVGDRVLLQRVFQNLIDNAITYRSPDRPLRIRITAHATGDGAQIAVQDNGIGIAEVEQTKVFDIFYKVDRHTSEGTGIGLAACKKILAQNDGAIAVRSTFGEGSTFTVRLPVARDTSPASADADMPSTASVLT